MLPLAAAITSATLLTTDDACGAFHILQGTGLMQKNTTLNPNHEPYNAANRTVCCGLCTQNPACTAWTYHPPKEQCYITADVQPHASSGGSNTVSGYKGSLPPTPAAPSRHPTPPPTPAPPTPIPDPPIGSFPNFVFLRNC